MKYREQFFYIGKKIVVFLCSLLVLSVLVFYDFASDSDRSAAILLWRACGEDECGGKRSDPGKTGTE